jgi:hypothetical protein
MNSREKDPAPRANGEYLTALPGGFARISCSCQTSSIPDEKYLKRKQAFVRTMPSITVGLAVAFFPKCPLSLAGAVTLLVGRHFSPFGDWVLIAGLLLIAAGSLWSSFSVNRLHLPIPR